MIRDYGFTIDELPFDDNGMLPRDKTPKQVWVEHFLCEPVDINAAP